MRISFSFCRMASHSQNITAALASASNAIAPSTRRSVSISFGLYLLSFCKFCHSFSFQYEIRWTGWENYCSTHGLGVWACTPQDLVGFLQHLYDLTRSMNSVQQSLSSIAHHYRVRGIPSPSEHTVVTLFMKGIKRRTLDRQPRRAVPMTVAVLSRLNAYLYSGLSACLLTIFIVLLLSFIR